MNLLDYRSTGYLLILSGILFVSSAELSNKNDDSDFKGIKMSLGKHDSDVDSSDTFHPTKEWQVIKPGQVIPPGLHVQMNLQTGEKMAKLMDSDEQKENRGDLLPVLSKTTDSDDKEQKAEKKDILTRKEILEALKGMKPDMDDVKDKKLSAEDIKKQFKSYDELKKDFEKINMAIKTDQEIVQNLVALYNSSETTRDKKLTILYDLEYYLHQIDNAQYFADIGAIDLLIRDFNASDAKIKTEAIFAFGSAVQSNVRVQIRALESGCMPVLIRLLVEESGETLLGRLVYALGGLLRHFPHAQTRFVKLGGLPALGALFDEKAVTARGVSLRVQAKVLTLLADLVGEKVSHAENADLNESMQKEKKKQYEDVGLEAVLRGQGWCGRIVSLLESTGQDHDIREKALVSMATVWHVCSDEALGYRVEHVLTELVREYKMLMVEEKDGDQFFTHMFTLAQKTLDRVAKGREEL